MREIIMLGGIHGAGKGYLGRILQDRLKVEVYTASKLISQDNKTTDKRVDDIQKNQNILLDAINKYIPDSSFNILDGHFCLLNSAKEIVPLDINVYKELNIVGIIVITAEAKIIAERLFERDGIEYPQDFINEFQKYEVESATNLSKALGKELIIYKNGSNVEVILEFVRKIKGGK